MNINLFLNIFLDYNIFIKNNKKNFFFSLLFYLKINNKSNFFLNKNKLDLLFIYTKFSLIDSNFFINNYINNFFYNQNIYDYSSNDISLKTPVVAGLSNSYDFIWKRLVYLTIGSFLYLPLNYTKSGYYVPFIIRKNKKKFIENIGNFIFIKKYNLNLFNSIIFFYKYKFYNIFFNQKPNISLSILYFFTKKKKINFFEYSNFLKQYFFFSKNYKNFDFWKFSWIIKKKNKIFKLKNFFNINVKSKQKYMLKFHRLNFNILFSTHFKSHRLTNIFKKISSNNKFFNFYKKLELNLLFILIRSKFTFNIEDSIFLVKNKYIFINGLPCLNYHYIVKKNDRIQILNNIYNYIYQRFITSNNLTRYYRMWNTFNKLQILKNKPYKIQSIKNKKWIKKSLWITTDIPKYMEIDFQIYTIFLIYEPISNIDIFSFFFSNFKIPLIKFLNWKYYY